MKTINYRLLDKNDSLAYREIRLESLYLEPESFSASFETQKKRAKLSFQNDLEKGSVSKFIIGAFDDKKLIGIFAFTSDNLFSLEKTGSLLQMYVKKDYRGLGIGKELAKIAIAHALEKDLCKDFLLEITPNNLKVKTMYQAFGFKESSFHSASPKESIVMLLKN